MHNKEEVVPDHRGKGLVDMRPFSGPCSKKRPISPQVRVLELENELQKERQKLGELRKKHYELAGVAEGWEEGEPDRGLRSPWGWGRM